MGANEAVTFEKNNQKIREDATECCKWKSRKKRTTDV